ncbi:PQQ-dependent sugar dehydrogenase [Halomonas sp. ZH2S]|uniref:PQQ-dependent sugar dehydrogenase n=1 Tax=Vreelandella zhuhanensis TaxID=2684210 RepID=A0A7X3H2S6_9GAMM|nr:PQQ-dependent sugar dehydrogenase [Halomonas zhuhanensis]MWJ29286.1 PQQ-dependent sugar dehydrogenase [Halomonas zhuhanensis]
MPPSLRFAYPRAVTVPAAVGALLSSGWLSAAEVIEPQLSTELLELRLERIADDLEHPWSLAFLPDGRFLISERPGRLLLVTEEGEKTAIQGLPRVNSQSQGGLLDIALHPRFGEGEQEDKQNDWLYFTWSKAVNGGTLTALSRARLGDDQLDDKRLSEPELLFEQQRAAGTRHHYGSRLAWLPDDTLLMSIGDRGNDQRAQDASDSAGSVLRLTADGGIPDDNPFTRDPQTLDAIYTLGHRNIQGMVVTYEGQAWVSEHGPLGGDEINLLKAGENYGWPEVSLGLDYSTREPIGANSLPAMRNPAYVFEGRFAPSGLTEATNEAFAPWQGNLLAGGLRSEQLKRLVVEDAEIIESEVILDGEIGRIRDVRQGPDGAIYLLTDHSSGGLYRLRPTE